MQLNFKVYTLFILILAYKIFQVSYEVSNKFGFFLRCVFFNVSPPEFDFLQL